MAKGRVEWTRLSGNEVEDVVALMIDREHPTATHITPSRGDGGVDILVRGEGPDGSDVVYQVKRFTNPLRAREKSAVEDSLRSLRTDPRWSNLDVRQWVLVMPWDPTPEAETWFHDLCSDHSVTGVWKGLTHVDRLAANYPEVVDYYLRGGQTRITEALKILTDYNNLQTTSTPPQVPEVVKRVKSALRVLEDDPLYRYHLTTGHGELPTEVSNPNAVMMTVSGDTRTDEWEAVEVVARCAMSTVLRPIKVDVTVTAKQGSAFESDLRDFDAYGAPFESPFGAAKGTIDAPGGLATEFDGAKVRSSPIADEYDGPEEFFLESISPAGEVLSQANVDIIERTRGSTGSRIVMQEENRTFTIEYREADAGGQSQRVRFGPPTGVPVTQASAALSFLADCGPPNSVRVSVRHTPAINGTVIPEFSGAWPEDSGAALTWLHSIIGDLVALQNRSSAVIRVPDFKTISPETVAGWARARKLLSGEGLTLLQPDGGVAFEVEDDEAPADEPVDSILVPLIIEVGDQSIALGQAKFEFKDPSVEFETRDGKQFVVFNSPDRQFTVSVPK